MSNEPVRDKIKRLRQYWQIRDMSYSRFWVTSESQDIKRQIADLELLIKN